MPSTVAVSSPVCLFATTSRSVERSLRERDCMNCKAASVETAASVFEAGSLY